MALTSTLLSRMDPWPLWKRALVGAGFGALTAFAFAPLRWPIALAAGLSGLALLIEPLIQQPRGARAAFITGTAFGAAYFSIGMMWLANAFLVQAEQFAWMIPIVLPAFFIFLGVFYGAACLGHILIRRHFIIHPAMAVLPFAVTLAITEWLRGHIISGLPWNLHAQAMAGTTFGLQPLALLGPYGYGLVLTLIALAPAALILDRSNAKRTIAGLLILVGGLSIYSGVRLTIQPAEDRTDAQLVIVQPNLAQRDKLDPNKQLASLRRSLAVTGERASSLADDSAPSTVYALWPENAYPFLDELQGFGPAVSNVLPPNAWLISGSLRQIEEGFTNGLFVFGPASEGSPVVAAYDKHRLVPFGETLPFYSVFAALGLESLSPTGGRGFVPGNGPAYVSAGPAPFAPLICYEDIFPGALYPKEQRPDWLAVVTNDAWFGDRAGPMQHLDIAKMRAVETGLPIARSANTGISALIDSEGRVRKRLPLYESGTITASLPVRRSQTAYARYGNVKFLAILSLIVLLVMAGRMQGEIELGNSSEPGRDGTRG